VHDTAFAQAALQTDAGSEELPPHPCVALPTSTTPTIATPNIEITFFDISGPLSLKIPGRHSITRAARAERRARGKLSAIGVNDASRLSRFAPAASIAVVTVAAGWLATASLQQDFAAYWVAGAACRAGLDPYVNHVGLATPELWDGVAVFTHSRFLYPPIVVELFRPFAALPYAAAKIVFTLLAVAAWVGASARDGRALVLGAGALFYPLYLHLERGQVDLFVLLLLLAAFDRRARPFVAGAALAAAMAFKPALVGVLPVVAALGRARVVGAALVGVALVVVASVATAGTALTWEYVRDVLPRAALYGEGGDASMLLPVDRLAAHADDLEAGVARIQGRAYRQAAWDVPASASLPRLLAPDGPTPLTSRAPPLILVGALVGVAARARRRLTDATVALLSWSAALACVVASPAGWLMSFVWALPVVPWLWGARAAFRPSLRAALGIAWLACALPPFVAGEPAVAATALVVAVVVAALRLRADTAAP
jgi:hypothetical protein